jgi:hypothetical protein
MIDGSLADKLVGSFGSAEVVHEAGKRLTCLPVRGSGGGRILEQRERASVLAVTTKFNTACDGKTDVCVDSHHAADDEPSPMETF